MQQYNIDFTTQFKEDILSIYNFIKQDNVEYADAVINSILSHCTGLLSIMPYIWSSMKANENIRKTIEQSFGYTIIYTIDEEKNKISFLWTYKKRK